MKTKSGEIQYTFTIYKGHLLIQSSQSTFITEASAEIIEYTYIEKPSIQK